MNEVFVNRIVDRLTFHQWLNVEYGIVKREFKECSSEAKLRLKKQYDEYAKDL